MHKITRIIALILGVLGLALCGWLMISSDKVKNSLSNFPMNGMFILGYLLLAIGLVVVIFSATKNILSSPKSIKKTLLYSGVFLGIMILSYPLSYMFRENYDLAVNIIKDFIIKNGSISVSDARDLLNSNRKSTMESH